MRTIELKYKCQCLREEVSFTVRERLPEEELADYMENYVQVGLIFDHMTRAPRCTSPKIEYLKLPVESHAGLGFSAEGGNA